MNWNKYKYIYIIIIQFLLVLAGHMFMGSDQLASSMWPAIGFAVVFYLNEKKSLLPIFIGTIIAHFVNQIFIVDNSWLLAIAYSIYFSVVSLIEVILFKSIYLYIKKKLTFRYLELVSLLVSYIVTAIIGGFIVTLTILIVYQQFNIGVGLRWAVGDFFGMAIFASTLYFVYSIDRRMTPLTWKSILTVLIYIIFSYVIFTSDPESHTYLHYVILFIPIYVVAAIYFTFAMFTFLNIIHILMFQLLYSSHININDLGSFLTSLNIVLLVLTFVSIFIKLVLLDNEMQKKLVIEKNDRLNKVMSSIHEFFNLSSGFDSTLESFDENYMKSIFTLAKEMFGNFDGGSSYMIDGEYVKFVYAEGMDIDNLNSFKFKTEAFSFEMDKPILHKISNKDLERTIGERKLQDYIDTNPVITESVYMGFYLSNGKLGGVSFDIFLGNDYHYTKEDLEVFESFQKTMNDLYKSSVLIEENQSLKNSVVLGLVRAVNLYDNYTKGHCEDVSYVAKEIAIRMGFDNKQVGLIEIAGLLHDVGKLGIPRTILNKPSKLTDEEYEVIKQHAQLGSDILSDLPDMTDIATYIKHHHERWDGKGYPTGLSENQIPIGAQILGVCDAACSMLEGRVYAKKKSVDDVIDELNRCKGTQFSPIPTDVLIGMLKNQKIVDKILAFYKED